MQVGDLRLNWIACTAWGGGRRIELTPLETRLLGLLMLHPGKECSRKFSFEHVWGLDVTIVSGFLDGHSNHLRTKIETGPETRIILTVRGVGYMVKGEG